MLRVWCLAMAVLIVPVAAWAELQTQTFDADPGWVSVGSRVGRSHARAVTQDFGHSPTSFAGGVGSGEIGGTVARSLTPAMYWTEIASASLDDRLEASGKFAVTAAGGGSGVLLGWFNAESRGWRTPNSLALRIDGNGGNFWVFFDYGTRELGTGGGDTFEGDRYQTTPTDPEPADGSVHEWRLVYTPDGAGGDGEIQLTLDGATHSVALAPVHKAQGATFNRFGIVNQQTSGDELTLYVDDVTVGGRSYDFAAKSGWEGVGARATFRDAAIRPYHDFGYSDTAHAGGSVGEIGGLVWRIEEANIGEAAYYAVDVGGLTMDDQLYAAGRVAMTRAGADSAVPIGWFDSRTFVGAPPASFLGVMVEGPSRVGHYFRPAYSNREGGGGVVSEGPVMRPSDRSFAWTLEYDPTADQGRGEITVALDDDRVSVPLDDGVRAVGASYDRFGIVSYQRGGHHVEIWLDDLQYTTGLAR